MSTLAARGRDGAAARSRFWQYMEEAVGAWNESCSFPGANFRLPNGLG